MQPINLGMQLTHLSMLSPNFSIKVIYVKTELKEMLKDLPQTNSLAAMIEYSIYSSDKGDYVLQCLTLKDMNPNGWI